MPLTVSPETFVTLWKKCRADKTLDISLLLTYAQPFLTWWEEMLRDPTVADHPTFLSLLRMLECEGPPLLMIREWRAEQDRLDSVMDALTILFIVRVRSLRWMTGKTRTMRYMEYLIADDFKSYLRNMIRSTWLTRAQHSVMNVDLREDSLVSSPMESEYSDVSRTLEDPYWWWLAYAASQKRYAETAHRYDIDISEEALCQILENR